MIYILFYIFLASPLPLCPGFCLKMGEDGGGWGVQPSPSRQPSLDEKGSLGTPPPVGGIGVGGVSEKGPIWGIFLRSKEPASLSVQLLPVLHVSHHLKL